MPTILRIGPYRFHFYSDESEEPPHIHIRSGDGDCKFWLNPVSFQKFYLMEKYNEYHKQQGG